MKQTSSEIKKKVENTLNLWVKRIYVISFNFYAFYWLYKLIWLNDSSTWEDYLLWFFTVIGMHFFVLENQDLFLRDKNGQKV